MKILIILFLSFLSLGVQSASHTENEEISRGHGNRLIEQAEETGTSRPSSTTSKSWGSTFSFVSHSSHEKGENEGPIESANAPVLEHNSTAVHSPDNPDEDL